MSQINGTEYVDRHNRPSVLSKVGLLAYFINDGSYQDPYAISGVSIFDKSVNVTGTVLDSENLIAASSTDLIKMHFANVDANASGSTFDASNYSVGASGIYRLSTGKYIVILDGTVDLSGLYTFYGQSQLIQNTASATSQYIDIWTIQTAQASKLKTVIQNFTLYDDTFFAVTQPILFNIRAKILKNRFTLGTKERLKVGLEIAVDNKDITQDIKNIFKDGLVTSASFEIKKRNDARTLPPTVTVSGFADTSSLVDISSDDTLSLLFDTELLKTHASVSSGDFGPIRGTYELVAEMRILDEIRRSQPLYFTVN